MVFFAAARGGRPKVKLLSDGYLDRGAAEK